MAYKVLALKWRPRSFSEVVGQQATLLALQHSLDNNQAHHAYIFTGTRGVGKTSIARILAKCLICELGVSSKPCGSCSSCASIDSGDCVDVIEVDAASRTKVEDTRDLLDNMPYAPVQARYKIYIIDEVHMLSNHSFNALLKTLEEPPAHVKFILATTDPQKLPVTVLSRCVQFHLRNFTVEQITQQLEHILSAEQISFAKPGLVAIARAANGSMRDALSLSEQVIAFGERNLTLAAAQQILGVCEDEKILQLLELMAQKDARGVITAVRDLAAINVDFNRVLKSLQTLIHQLSLVQIVPDAMQDLALDVARMQSIAAKISPLDLQLYYQATLLGVRDLPYAPDIVSGFEMIVLRMLAFQPALVNTESQVVSAPAPVVISKPVVESKPMTIPAPAPSPTTVAIPAQIDVQPAPQSAVDNHSWAQILSNLSLPGLTKVIAEHCTLESWQDDKMALILSEAQKPLLNAKHIERMQDALQKYTGKAIKLTITAGTSNAETPAAQGQRMQQAAHSAALDAIKSDPHIQQLEQVFAAKIDSVTGV